jgi:signal transduction histidine kinase
MRQYFRSLWFRLIFGLILGSVAAITVASIFLYIRFENVSAESRELTLQGQAKLIAKCFRSAGDRSLQLPATIAPYYRDGTGEFVILSPEEKVLASSNGIKQPFHPIDPQSGREFFSYSQQEGRPPYHGISLKIKGTSEPLWIQVVFKDNEVIFGSVLEEFVQDIAWIWLPFVVILLGINLLVIRIGLRPLVLASEQASKIGPSAVSRRLPEEGMPAEVLSFVKAINEALDRLEDGYKAQQAFIADAAHELRTPVTVMSTQMDMLPSFHGKAALKGEIYGLKRLVSQLLDSARCDAIQIEPSSRVELNKLAADVASYLAPWAISIGKTVEVFGFDRSITIHGDYDFLFRALRNLVENAIEHTKPGTAASIFVRSPAIIAVADRGPGVPLADRERIFERFWQGGRDRNSGAGLGMSIISRTVAAHRGTIAVGDRRRGGAVFTLTFPLLRQRSTNTPIEQGRHFAVRQYAEKH